MSITVVIPTHNRHAGLRDLLDDLAAQQGDVAPEVIVVDSPEAEDSSGIVVAAAERGLNARHLLTENNRAGKRNAGAQAAAGELLAFLDDDMRVPPTWLAAHLSAHADGVERCVCGDVVFPVDWVEQSNYYRYKQGQHRQRAARDGLGSGRLAPQRIVTMNLSIPRTTWLHLGGNDEEFAHYGGEDVEFGFRLARAGVPIEFSAAAWAWHYEVRIDIVTWARKLYNSAYDAAGLVVAKAPEAAGVRTFRWSEPGLQRRPADRLVHGAVRALARPGLVSGLARGLRRADHIRPLYARLPYQVLTTLATQLGVDDRVAGRAKRGDDLFS